MKTKNLLQTSILFIALCVMNQFALAQCQSNKVLISNTNNCCQTKCINPNQVSHYLSHGWVLGPPWCCIGPRIANQINYETALSGIAPNPVSQSTTIAFTLSQSENVSLKIFDVNGRLVATLADKTFEEGDNELVWSAEEVSAGVYFLQFQSAENLQTEKLIVTK